MKKLSPRNASLIRDALLKLEQSYRETAAQASREHLTFTYLDVIAAEIAELRESLKNAVLYYQDGQGCI